MNTRIKNLILRVTLVAFVAALLLPASTLANSQGRGRGKKSDVFVNGHDARDGRYDKRDKKNKNKVRRDRNDDYYDDDDDRDRRRNRRRDQDRDNDGINDRSEISRQAVSVGYDEGYRAGRDDRDRGENHDYRDERAYRDATTGYRDNYGDVNTYRRGFRQGFQQGYEDGYRNRNSRTGSSGIGDILGGILGRP